MAKRIETLQIEEALANECRTKRIYGCEEVTIGFPHQGKGNEVVDFMTMDSKGIFRCYEIKVTLADLKSKAKKSWYGHYNYLVVSQNLFGKVSDWKEYLPGHVGLIICKGSSEYSFLESVFKAKQMEVSSDEIEILKDSLIRSMYFKKEKYKDANNLDKHKELKSECKKWEKRYREELVKSSEYWELIRRYERLSRKLTGQRIHFEVMLEEMEREINALECNKGTEYSD